ncbi:MAG: hypothetical protein QGF53_04475 [Alphaproteobacteria bacterium]|jgi:hypothetical protein|nr:hypothetical protein [Alphaproteobacteria bacterium]
MAGALVIAALVADMTVAVPVPLLIQENSPPVAPPSSQLLDDPGETTTIGPDAPAPSPPVSRSSDWVRRFYGPILSVAPEIVGEEYPGQQQEETAP